MTTDALALAGRTSEAYAWLILSIGVGQSAGTALAGRLAEQPLTSAVLPAAGAPSLSPSFSPRADSSAPPDTGRAADTAAHSEAGTRRPDLGAPPPSNPF